MSNELPPDALGGVKWEMKKPSDQVLTNKEAREFLKISEHALCISPLNSWTENLKTYWEYVQH